PLFRSSVAEEHFHVPGVRRRAVEHLGGPRHASHDLAQRRVLEVGEPGAPLAIGEEEVPQTLLASPNLQLLDERSGLPPVTLSQFPGVTVLVRVNVLIHEGGQSRQERSDLGRMFDHAVSGTSVATMKQMIVSHATTFSACISSSST